MKKVVGSLLALALVTGCSSKPTEPTSTPEPTPVTTDTPTEGGTPDTGIAMACTVESGNDKFVNTYYYSGNIVTDVEQEVFYSLLSGDHQLEDLLKQAESDKLVFEDAAGITASAGEQEDFFVTKVTYEVGTISDDFKVFAGLFDEAKEGDIYDVNKVVKNMEDEGATCIAK